MRSRILTPKLRARVLAVLPLAVAQRRFPEGVRPCDFVQYALRERSLNNYLRGKAQGHTLRYKRRAVESLAYAVERQAAHRRQA